MRAGRNWFMACCLGLLAVSAPAQTMVDTRAACIQGRRIICGRVLQITPAGLVVDSGYTGLLQPPLNHAWLNRATALAPPRCWKNPLPMRLPSDPSC